MEDEAQPRRTWFSDCPHRFAQRRFPTFFGFLRTLGYDEALIVKDIVHVALYMSFFISFVFVATWANDVVSLNCLKTGKWVGWVGKYRCAYELVGAFLFFGTLRDSMQMIAHYDSQHGELLEKKKKLMNDLHSDISSALQKAKENSGTLFNMLFTMYESQVGQYVEEYFDNILPTLSQKLLRRGRDVEQEATMLRELTDLLGANLAEPRLLASALISKLVDVYREVELKTNQNSGMPDVELAESTTFLPSALRETDVRSPPFWTARVQQSRLQRYLSDPVIADAYIQGTSNDKEEKPGAQVFLPLKKMGTFLDTFMNSDYMRRLQLESSEHYETPDIEHLIGFGAAPEGWACVEPRPRSFCVPRLLACVCCVCRFRVCKSTVFDPALKYPKRVSVGCFWFQLMSKLHERIIQSILLNTVYVSFYVWRLGAVVGSSGCPDEEFWLCVLDMNRRSLVVLALLANIPFLLVCLWRIHDLDAIIQIMEDINKLEDIRGVVRDFERSTEADTQRRRVFQAVEDRMLVRIALTQSFRHHIMQNEVKKERKLLLSSTQQLLSCLQWTAKKLKTPAEFALLSDEEQRARVEEVKLHHEELKARGFQSTTLDELEETAEPEIVGEELRPSIEILTEMASPEGFSSLRRTLTPPLGGIPSTEQGLRSSLLPHQ